MGLHYDREFSQAVINARAYVNRFVQKAIDYRNALDSGNGGSQKPHELDQQYVFLYELSKRTLNKTELTDQLLSILLAGRDTTASLLSITFFVMARRPDIWKKLRQEVLKLEGRKPSFQDLKSISYLTWVMNESTYTHSQTKINFNLFPKLYGSIPLSPSTYEWPTKTPTFRSEEAQTAKIQSSSPRDRRLCTVYTPCTAGKTSSAQMRTSTGQRDGKNSSQVGHTSRSMVGPVSV